MNKYDFKNISIRGRVAFGICCLNTYLKHSYPDNDYSTLIDLVCKITEDSEYIDVSTMAFMEIIPEYLYEFDNYDDAGFEYISEEQYNELTAIIPKEDVSLNSLMYAIYKIAWEYSYVAIDLSATKTYPYLSTIIEEMNKHNLPLPNIKDFQQYDFNVFDGWGRHINRTEYLK